MKKRIVKLGPKQLRSLIKEAIQAREPGSPLWSPPKENKRRHNEAVEPGADDSYRDDFSSFKHEFADQVAQVWKGFYDENDPSMQSRGSFAGGQQFWNSQVENASSELYDLVGEAIKSVELKLLEGDFYDSRKSNY